MVTSFVFLFPFPGMGKGDDAPSVAHVVTDRPEHGGKIAFDAFGAKRAAVACDVCKSIPPRPSIVTCAKAGAKLAAVVDSPPVHAVTLADGMRWPVGAAGVK